MGYQLVNANVDTWILNVRGQLSDQLQEDLTQLKALAQEVEHEVPTRWAFEGQTLFLRPTGGGAQWKWVLYCQDYLHLDIGVGKLNGIICKARISSLYLHMRDIEKVLHRVHVFLLALLGEAIDLQVSEVHLCADIAGWDLTLADAERFVSRGRSKKIRLADGDDDEQQIQPSIPEVTLTGRRATQFDFSKTAPHACCIYDKTKEVTVHAKQWFHEIWRQHGWDGASRVVRVEFRYARECLRELGIECPYDLLGQFAGLWAYSAQKWLRHTIPQGQNQTRWQLSEVWQLIQDAEFNGEAVPLVREKKVELDAERSKAGFVGYATSWAVREVFQYHRGLMPDGETRGLPLRAVDEDGGGFLAWAFDPVTAYLQERKEASFIDVMQEKAKRLGISLVA